MARAPLTWPHLTRVHQLELLEFGVVLQAELLQLDGVRGLKALPVLLRGGRQAVPLRRFLRHVTRAQCLKRGNAGANKGRILPRFESQFLIRDDGSK